MNSIQNVSTFLKSSDSTNPLNDYAKKTYVDDKIKNIKGGGSVDLSGYTKETEFISFKDKVQKDMTTFRSEVAKNYTLKKDLDVAGIGKRLSALMGREFFNGTDGTINEHVYSPDLRQIKFVAGNKGQVGEWLSSGKNPAVIRNFSTSSHPLVDVNADEFEMKFRGGRLGYGDTSKFNSSVTNVYLVYKLYLFNSPPNPKYPLVNSLFGAVKVNKKGSTDPKKWEFDGKGIAFVSGRTFSMGAQGSARNVVIFGVDNSSSKHPVNKKNDFMILGKWNLSDCGKSRYHSRKRTRIKHDLSREKVRYQYSLFGRRQSALRQRNSNDRF